MPQEEDGPGLPLEWGQGDKTLIQVDHSSITPEHSHQEVMTLYKLLTLLERTKKITEHKVSYSDCSRAAQGASDAFKVTLSQPHKYKTLPSQSEKISSKSFFGQSMLDVEGSSLIGKVFRFRFERVTGCLKIQKPYVMALRGLTLKPKQPVQIA